MAREKPTKAQARRAKKDRVIEAARELVRTGVISSRTGPAAPVFDEHDAEVERSRGQSYSVDGGKLDHLRDTLADLDR